MEVFKARIVIKMKTCTGCNQSKALIEFYKHCQKPNGLRARCKVCVNIYQWQHQWALHSHNFQLHPRRHNFQQEKENEATPLT